MYITVQAKSNEMFSPLCEKAKALAATAGGVMTRNTLKQAQQLGFVVILCDAQGRPSCELRVA